MPVFTLRTGADVRDKIDWEGGVCGAIDSGLEAADLPAPYRVDFAEIQAAYRHLDTLCTAFYNALPDQEQGDPPCAPSA